MPLIAVAHCVQLPRVQAHSGELRSPSWLRTASDAPDRYLSILEIGHFRVRHAPLTPPLPSGTPASYVVRRQQRVGCPPARQRDDRNLLAAPRGDA